MVTARSLGTWSSTTISRKERHWLARSATRSKRSRPSALPTFSGRKSMPPNSWAVVWMSTPAGSLALSCSTAWEVGWKKSSPPK